MESISSKKKHSFLRSCSCSVFYCLKTIKFLQVTCKTQLMIIYVSCTYSILFIQIQNLHINFILHPGHNFQKLLWSWGLTNSVLFLWCFYFVHMMHACLCICWSLEGFSLGKIDDLQIKRIISIVIWI